MQFATPKQSFFWLGLIVGLTVATNQTIHIAWEGADFGELLWFCDFISYVLATAFFTRNKFLMSVVLLASVPAQFLWIADFFMNIIGSGMGRTDWLFTDNYLWVTPWVSTFMHAIIIPFSAYGVFRLGFDKRSIWGVFAIILVLLPFTFWFTDPTINRNCVFFPCDLNFVDDRAYISAHANYFMTYKYLLKEMLSWIFYSGATYFLFLAWIHLWRKFAKRYNLSKLNKYGGTQ